MTGLMHEKEFSRKSFVKGSGAMIVGFSLVGAAIGSKTAMAAGSSPFQSAGPPNPTQVDSWIVIHPDNTASIYTGRMEFGHGSSVGLLQIAGEELGMDFHQLEFVRADTNLVPNSGGEDASTSIKNAGLYLRAASAAAGAALLNLASQNMGVPTTSLSVSSGVVSGGGKSVTYGQLIGGQLFNVTVPSITNSAGAAGGGLQPGAPGTKPVSEYTLVTTRVARLDIPAKVIGTYTYIHNVRVPGMLHGRIVRPRGQGAFGAAGSGAPIESVDQNSISHIPNVQVVQVGNFLGVVAPHEYDAIQAAALLKATWGVGETLPGSGNLHASMVSQPTTDTVTAQAGTLSAGFAQAATVISATYGFPYQTHGMIGPSCAVADVTPDGAVVMSNSESPYGTRTSVSTMLGLPVNQVRVIFYEGSSSFGNGPWDDAAEAAALMSNAVGKPVRVQFMRWDEMGWDNYDPANVSQIQAGINASGQIVAWQYQAWQHGWMTSTHEPSWQLAQNTPFKAASTFAVTLRNGGGIYNIPNFELLNHQLSGLNGSLRSSYMRAPMCLQPYFSSEQMIDALAHAANMDPVAFRQLNMGSDDGWLIALDGVAKAANWQSKVAASNLQSGDIVTGRGIALGSEITSYAGVIADITVNKKTGVITVNHMTAALNAGLAVNPALIENQMSGQQVQGTSRAIVEEMPFTKTHVTGLDWVTYPILRFEDSPTVTTVVLQQLSQPPSGAGEESMAPVPGAIANAFFDATGVRIYQYPMTPARVRAVLQAAGVA